jgi:hypothetical protein
LVFIKSAAMPCFISEHELLPQTPTTPVHLIEPESYPAHRAQATAHHQCWADQHGFKAKAGQVLILPDDTGAIAQVWVGADPQQSPLWALASMPAKLPEGVYCLSEESLAPWPKHCQPLAYVGLGLASYRFDRYKDHNPSQGHWVLPDAYRSDLLVTTPLQWYAGSYGTNIDMNTLCLDILAWGRTRRAQITNFTTSCGNCVLGQMLNIVHQRKCK